MIITSVLEHTDSQSYIKFHGADIIYFCYGNKNNYLLSLN